jgi:ATP/ADP translocase
MVQAQFWSFANDLYTEEQGKRLFAIVGFGATLSGVAGAKWLGALDDFRNWLIREAASMASY